MLSTLFRKKPVVATETRDWILDTFAWALEYCDLQVFKNDSQLILPNNQFYPGRVTSVEEMAQSIFDNTVNYAGMSNWPLRLVNLQHVTSQNFPKLSLSENVRGKLAHITSLDETNQVIEIGYHSAQVNQPQDLISSIVQTLATALVINTQPLPPGGKECLAQAIELVACFMGFGIMFSNTAYQFRGGCGSCNNRSANRQATLSENDTVYCLALFCVLKSIPVKQVTPHLKAHLRNGFKNAYKELTVYLNQSTHPLLLAAQD